MLCTEDGFVDSLRPPKRWPRSFAEMSKGNHPKIAISAFDGLERGQSIVLSRKQTWQQKILIFSIARFDYWLVSIRDASWLYNVLQ